MKTTLRLLPLFFGLLGTLSAQRDVPRFNYELQEGVFLNTITLGLFHERQDYRLTGLGGGLDFTFYYNSTNLNLDYGFGKGWSFTYNYVYEIDTSGPNPLFCLHRDDGSFDEYQFLAGAWVAPVGVYDSLEEYAPDQFRLTTKHGIQLFFDDNAHRRLTSVADRNANTTTINYTAGLPTSVVDPAGRAISLVYAGAKLISLSNAGVAPTPTVTYTYDGLDRLATVTDTEGHTTQYEYDDGGMSGIGGPGGGMFTRNSMGGKTKKTNNQKNKQEIQEDPTKKLLKIIEGLQLKREITFEKDTCNRITKIRRGCCGGEQNLTYDANNNLTGLTDDSGNTTTHSYDALGNRLSTTHPSGATESWTYDPIFSLPLSYTDPNGNSVTYTYDANGNLLTETFPTHSTTRAYNAQGQVTSTTDGRGNTTTYAYDANGFLTSVTDPLGNSTVYTVDAVGNIQSVTDPKGNSIQYTHDTKGNITSFTDAAGNQSTFTYDAAGNRTAITDPNGNTTTFIYDAFRRKTGEVSPSGLTESWAYDEYSNITEYTDPRGNRTTYTYDPAGNLVRETDALGTSTEFTYDTRGNLLTQTNPDGAVTTYTYDSMDRLVSKTDPLGNTESRSYDAAGNIISLTDGLGNTSSLTYDGLNRLVTQTDPLSNTQTYTYDANGNLTSTTDKRGNTTTYAYDAANQLTSVTDPLGGLTTYGYDAAGYLSSLTDPLGQTYLQTYDSRGLVTSETNAAGEVSTSSYDVLGNLIAMTLPNGRTVNYQLDTDYRLTEMSDGDGTLVTFTYDANGNLLTETNGAGEQVLAVEYDALDRVVRETDGNGQSATYEYDSRDNVVRAVSRDGEAIRFIFDERDLKTGVINQDGSALTYDYDANSNLIQETDENGNATLFDYDGLDRLIRVSYPDGTDRLTAYDANDNPISETNVDGSVMLYTYDANNQLITVDRPGSMDDLFSYDLAGQMIGAINPDAVLSFTYDAAGRILSETLNGKTTAYSYATASNELTVTYPGGRTILQRMDDRANLSAVLEGGSPIQSFTYDSADRLVGSTYGNGTATTYTYNPVGLLSGIAHTAGGSPFVGFSFQYAPNGQLTGKDFTHRPEDSERYFYDRNDRLYRLVKGTVINDRIPNPSQREAFIYDGVGNRQQDQQNNDIRTWSVNGLNQYLDFSDGGGSTPFVYDSNGNLTADGVNTYVFDTNHRLLSSTGAASATYQYDPLGRRISQMVDGVRTDFYYDGARVIEERDAADAITATYVYGIDLDDVLSMHRSGTDYFYHKDQNGNVVALTDGSGAVVERYDYSAFGQPFFYDDAFNPLAGSAVGNPYLFTGRRYDAHSGLYYYRERYYQPNLGRFLSRDPLGTLDDANLYAYVGNDPGNSIDPQGTLRYIERWTPTRHPIKWEEIGTDFKRTPGKKRTRYFKRQCCCIEASCDEFSLTTTTRFRGYQKYIKTNPRWWRLYTRVRFLAGSLKSDLENILELIEILNEGGDEAFGLKASLQDLIALGLSAVPTRGGGVGVPGAGSISKVVTGDAPDAVTRRTDYAGFAISGGTTAAVQGGLITAGSTSASAAGGYAGLAFAAGFTLGTKLKQAWVLSSMSSEIAEKIEAAAEKARRLKKMAEELRGTEQFLRKYEERTKSESRTDRQKENFSAKQVPSSKCQ